MAGWFWMASLSRYRRKKVPLSLDHPPPQDNINWAELPSDLLCSIARRLPIPEHLRLRAVCVSWASALKDFRLMIHHFTYLMTVCRGDKKELSQVSLQGGKSYRLPLLPDIRGKIWCVGCQHGWLVIVHGLNILLLNPITGAQIPLPSFCMQEDVDHRYDPCVTKVVLSAIPSTASGNAFGAVAITKFGRLASVRTGDQAWVLGHTPPLCCFHDIVHHNGTFFGLSSSTTTTLTSRRSQFLTIGFKESKFEFVSHGDKEDLTWTLTSKLNMGMFLVSSPIGELLKIKGTRDPDNQKFKSFTVMIFHPSTKKASCWVEIKDLGGRSLFIDGMHSILLSSTDVVGLKENCIYFVESLYTCKGELVVDAGLFDIGKGMREPCFPSGVHLEHLRSVTPLWFTPSLF